MIVMMMVSIGMIHHDDGNMLNNACDTMVKLT